jgi:predicted RNase H-like HicB family nuclease
MMEKAYSAQDLLKKPYARILVPAEDGTYAAELLEFPGCFAQGDTAQQAIENLEDAAVAWIDAATGQNQEIPEPLATYGCSGKISLRIPRSIHKKALRLAQKDDVSLNQFFASAIAARVGAEDIFDRLLEKIRTWLVPASSTSQVGQVMTVVVANAPQTLLCPGCSPIQIENSRPVSTVQDASPLRVVANG